VFVKKKERDASGVMAGSRRSLQRKRPVSAGRFFAFTAT
jgi:hypothetical protein